MQLFKFFKNKKENEDTSKTFEGRIITDEEIEKMITPKKETFVHKELREINDMMKDLKQNFEQTDLDGRE